MAATALEFFDRFVVGRGVAELARLLGETLLHNPSELTHPEGLVWLRMMSAGGIRYQET